MDNLTHSLVGLVIAKAGLERASPAATTVCIIAANAPDADILTAFRGSWTYLHNHRGLTHSIVGTLLLALLIPLAFWAGDRLLASIQHKPPRVVFRGVLLASLVASATHPLLDWTNNYGVRPLMPWSNEWFYGDLVFIVDPWLWLSLGGAAFLLAANTKWRVAAWAALAVIITAAMYALPARSETAYPFVSRVLWLAGIAGLMFAHRTHLARRYGAGIAAVALALIVVYWGALSVLQQRALSQTGIVAARIAEHNNETILRLAAMPTLANPLHWRCVVETNRATFRFELTLGERDVNDVAREVVRYEKPLGNEAALVRRAEEDKRAAILLDFARFPVARVEGDCRSGAFVQFADLRYTEPGSSGRGNFSLQVPVSCAPQ